MRPLFKILLFASFLAGSQFLSAATTEQDYVKTIKKDFANVSPTGTTFLSNKYGKVDVKTWAQNQVSITVKITVRTTSKSDADDVFERIKIQFSSGGDFVKASTEIESQSWWSSWWSSSSDYSIDYEVFMPPTNRLNLQNKYGNSFVAPLESSATLDISYGDFRLEKIPGALNVSLAYGKGTVINCKDMVSSVSYGDLHVENSSDLTLNTKYSDIHVVKALDVKTMSRYDDYDITSVRDLTTDSQYGGFKVGNANSLTLISRYTDLRLVKVLTSATIDMNYGELVIENLSKGFSNVTIKGAYTDVSIDVEAGASYKVDASTSYADISYPTGTKTSVDNERGTNREFKGIVGTSSSPSASITARLSYGGLVLK
jgi:hypothetical protein